MHWPLRRLIVRHNDNQRSTEVHFDQLSNTVWRERVDGQELYPDLWTKAAALMQSLIKNHSFVDDKKCTAVTATAIFLELNHRRLTASNDEVLRFTVQMAENRQSWRR